MKVEKQRNNQITDVIIAGGGPAGLTLAALLAANGADVICLDREPPHRQSDAGFDGRAIAISYGSRKVLEAAGLWQDLAPHGCPIETIQISDGDSKVLLNFDKEEVGGRTFGWITEIRHIRAALFDRLQQSSTTTGKAIHRAPATISDYTLHDDYVTVHLEDGAALKARLVVGADGRNSFTRQWMGIGTRGWSYNQRAIVCTAFHEHPHNQIALENFRPEGPFAVLPMHDRPDGTHCSSIVWTAHGADADRLINADQATFDAALAARFPDWYGAVRSTGKRFNYPLGLIHAHQYIGPRMALIAEAGHGIHPIAGQGLNMGLRDVAALAALVSEALRAGQDPGDPALLTRYQRARRFDNMAMAGTTDALNRLFSNNLPPVRAARRAGLRAVAHLPPAKRFFMKQAMGAAGLLPALIRDAGSDTARKDNAAA